MSRLRSYLFVCVSQTGDRHDVVFYASSLSQALSYAREWARRLRHHSVQPDRKSVV